MISIYYKNNEQIYSAIIIMLFELKGILLLPNIMIRIS